MKKYILILIMLLTAGSAVAESKNAFSPGKTCAELILNHINGAEKDIDISIYTFTYEPFAEALKKAHERGVKIRIFTDKGRIKTIHSQIPELARSGIEVRLFDRTAKMHNKFAIFDNKILLNGSYNWTGSAIRNAETCSFVSDDKQHLEDYHRQFEKLWHGYSIEYTPTETTSK